MARDFQVNGESLVRVQFGAHITGTSLTSGAGDLGLASEPITVTPTFFHRDILTDDFGPNVPAEVMWNLATVTIRMKLVHFDLDNLIFAYGESMAGGVPQGGPFPGDPIDGRLAPAGSLLGNGIALLSSGCHYVGLLIQSPVLGLPWHFPSAHMVGQPFIFPLGTEKTVADVTFRAITYVPLTSVGVHTSGTPGFKEISSSGVTLWDRNTF